MSRLSDQSRIDGDSGHFLDMSTSFDDSTSNDSINVTINILGHSEEIIGHLSGSMHLSELDVSQNSLSRSANTTRPDESYPSFNDNSYSFTVGNESLPGHLSGSMHLSELNTSLLNSTANTNISGHTSVGDESSFDGPPFDGPSYGGKRRRRRKKRTLKKKRSRKNKKRSRSRR